MRLYTRTGAAQVSVEGKVYTVGADGAFDFPPEVGAALHSFHVDGKPAWEDGAELAARLAAEQMEMLRDPATMLAELQKMTAGQGALTSLLAHALGVGKSTPEPEASQPVAPETSESASEPAPAGDEASESASQDAPPAKATRARKSAAAKASSAGE